MYPMPHLPRKVMSRGIWRPVLALFLLGGIVYQVPGAVRASATMYFVAPTGNDGNTCLSLASACATIGAAVGKASAGDTISIAVNSNPYAEHLTIGKDLTITGAGSAQTSIDGSNSGTVVTIAAGVTVSISGVTIQHGTSSSSCPGWTGSCGGGVYNSGTLTLANSRVTGNSATVGGGIYNGGTLTLTTSTVTGNTAPNGSGGGILNTGGAGIAPGTMSIADSTVSGNTAVSGGGILTFGPLTITSSTISGNNASGGMPSQGVGGGIYVGPNTPTIVNSTVSGNTASDNGGGIYIGPDDGIALANSTISGNSTGGIGGGIYSGNGTVTTKNTILAVNTAGVRDPDCFANLITQGYNLLGDPTDCTGLTGGVNGDQVRKAPMLGALQDNGGPTQTVALLTGSPAIDAGNPSGCKDPNGNALTTDQRGFTRPDDGESTCDIGAYESSASPLATPTQTDTSTMTPTSTATPTSTSTPTATPTSIPCKRYAATGDSIPFGDDLPTGSGQPYPSHLLQDHLVALGFTPACATNVAQVGASTYNYLYGGYDLFQPPTFHVQQLYPTEHFNPDLITITTGVDDYALPTMVNACIAKIATGNLGGSATACEDQILNNATQWNATERDLRTILSSYRDTIHKKLIVVVTNYYDPMPVRLSREAVMKLCDSTIVISAQAPEGCRSYFANVDIAFVRLNDIIRKLNTVIGSAVHQESQRTDEHVFLVDVYHEFLQGHCSPIVFSYLGFSANLGCSTMDTWIVPDPGIAGQLTQGGAHPNDVGHRCIANLIWEASKLALGSPEPPIARPCCLQGDVRLHR